MASLDAALSYRFGRIGWGILLLVWLSIAVGGGSEARRWIGPSIAAVVGVLVLYEIAKFGLSTTEFSKVSDENGFVKIHLAAALLHVASANGIGWATAGWDDGWLARITRTRSNWVPMAYNNETEKWVKAADYIINKTGYDPSSPVLEARCANYPCIITTETVVVTENWPLVDLAIAFALISAWYHYATVVNRAKTVYITDKIQPPLYKAALLYRYNPLRWHDYSCSAAVMLACVSSLCGVENWATILTTSVLLFVLLTFTLPLERDLAKREVEPSAEGPLSMDTLWSTFGVLCLAYLLMWLPTIFAFQSAFETDPKPPDVIYTILVSIIVLYTAFAVCFGVVAVARLGAPAASEEGFICLSFLSKVSDVAIRASLSWWW